MSIDETAGASSDPTPDAVGEGFSPEGEDDVEGHGLKEVAAGAAIAAGLAGATGLAAHAAGVNLATPKAPITVAQPTPPKADPIGAVNQLGSTLLPNTWRDGVAPVENTVLGLVGGAGTLVGDASTDVTTDATLVINDVKSNVDTVTQGTVNPALTSAVGQVNTDLGNAETGTINPTIQGANAIADAPISAGVTVNAAGKSATVSETVPATVPPAPDVNAPAVPDPQVPSL